MNDSNDDRPSGSALAALGVRVVSPLGGRMNRHWMVEAGGERCVLRRWASQSLESIGFERRLMAELKTAGWPVAPFDEPMEIQGSLWSLAEFLPGSSQPDAHASDPRERGGLLARLHTDLAQIEGLGKRSGWRRAEAILLDPRLDEILSKAEARRPEEVGIVRWHLDRARLRREGLDLEGWPSIPIHGDFTPWNLLYEGDRLTGLIDFELARNDHRLAEFALAWRGKYDAVIEGYAEVAPLSPEERAAIVPIWWAGLVEGFCRDAEKGEDDGGWTVGKLLARSPAMGPDAEARP